MNSDLIHLLIDGGLWLLIVGGWLILMADAVGYLRRWGQLSIWGIFMCVSCLLPVALWWTFAVA